MGDLTYFRSPVLIIGTGGDRRILATERWSVLVLPLTDAWVGFAPAADG